MQKITSTETLEQIYGAAAPRSLTKVATRLTPLYREWIAASRFLVLSTVGAEGTDASPRGDDGPVVHIADQRTLWLPDWRGNNRLDSLRNIVRDSRVSLMFMVHGSTNVVRVNGSAFLTADSSARAAFERKTLRPATVAVITLEELYFQCAKAILRSRLWDADAGRPALPTAGQFLQEQEAELEAEAYDAGYAEYAKSRMW
ncbi:MSMEG_1061 family FMN-dependent PPOX-type flavoprotein [Leisingera methylohalidivorans]|uniref:Pyridoxamine 5'-phosphate oxidase n=1 Tax=Leisingera methylohalidivorans DSM 14336 TaxID=999552 RepID=V9VPT9_9RHOB|nr:MSMEG_1061 family FMN-dependent PPOX-type flavoprotein [Leisingera methylohalidivorans]AHC99718.1 pyridoxamine 5'-phosphate oxidase [Leisingera methylohalidivorans DSM 14336]